MLRIKKISEITGKKVYTDAGDYFGEVEEANLVENKIDGWKIKIAGGMSNILGGARGVIIPHNYIKAMGDVVIINKAAIPSGEEEEITEDEPV